MIVVAVVAVTTPHGFPTPQTSWLVVHSTTRTSVHEARASAEAAVTSALRILFDPTTE